MEELRKLRRVGVRRRIMEIRARLGPDPEGRLKELEAKGKELKANLERLVKEDTTKRASTRWALIMAAMVGKPKMVATVFGKPTTVAITAR